MRIYCTIKQIINNSNNVKVNCLIAKLVNFLIQTVQDMTSLNFGLLFINIVFEVKLKHSF